MGTIFQKRLEKRHQKRPQKRPKILLWLTLISQVLNTLLFFSDFFRQVLTDFASRLKFNPSITWYSQAKTACSGVCIRPHNMFCIPVPGYVRGELANTDYYYYSTTGDSKYLQLILIKYILFKKPSVALLAVSYLTHHLHPCLPWRCMLYNSSCTHTSAMSRHRKINKTHAHTFCGHCAGRGGRREGSRGNSDSSMHAVGGGYGKCCSQQQRQ
jgi:hypothetical protein